MANPALRVKRDVLARFLPDHDTIRKFEELFQVAEEADSSSSGDALISAGNALAKANLAISQLKNSLKQTFETINENLKSYTKSFNYTGSRLDSVVYTFGTKTITKTLSYTGLQLNTVVLSGDTPHGINLTKTLSYSGLNLTGVVYS